MERRYPWLLCGILLLGLGVRIASAQGGLWLDEAWTAILVADHARTPLDVFLHINHDNNHHLNSLWMLGVGVDASPLLARAFSIASGSIAIYVAARIMAPRGRLPSLVTAFLFATSPILVTYGSEARGYAAMMLALLVAIRMIDRWLVDGGGRRTSTLIALCFALGTLSQMTMLFGCAALIGWVFLDLCRRGSPIAAARRTLGLFAPALIALAVTLGIIFGPALTSDTGFQVGSYEAFAWLPYLRGLIELVGFTIGWPVLSLWLLAGVVVLVVLAPDAGTTLIAFYRLAILAFPLATALLRIGNPGHPRYYLVAAIALLLLISELVATAIDRRGWRRVIGASLLIALGIGNIAQDADLMRNQRGNPEKAIALLAARAPGGSVVLLDRRIGLEILKAAAATARYPIRVVAHGCAPAGFLPARFLFVDRFRGEQFPSSFTRCGAHFRPIGQAMAHGLSGTNWTLHERQP